MIERPTDKIWLRLGMTRREFLRAFGIASGAITLSPFFVDRISKAFAQISTVKVYLVKNGDCFQSTAKLLEMMGGASKYIDSTDVVVIKGNAQWWNQGYTHTGCIKGVIDKILQIPGFSGEVLVCDNVQTGDPHGFEATVDMRAHNWPDHNWNSLAAEYQTHGKPVAAKKWLSNELDISGPSDGEGWIRDYFDFYGWNTYLSRPIFQSPVTPGRMIDMKNGVWESGGYTGREVKAIFMPTLNNHGGGSEDYAGVTSAIKSFFGATEIHTCWNCAWDHNNTTYDSIHSSAFNRSRADYAGELVARYINTMYSPVLYITAAMWSGYESRTGGAVETKTVLGCENPATLDYVACKYVISPYASWLNPDQNNNTRKQILGCINGGVGTINPAEFEVITYDFNNPTVNRLDIDRKIKDLKDGNATEREVKDLINEYMEVPP
jgi:hypothetical protein